MRYKSLIILLFAFILLPITVFAAAQDTELEACFDKAMPEHDSCVWNLAIERHDYDICNELEDIYYKSDCTREVAGVGATVEDCKYTASPPECFVRFAVEENNGAICGMASVRNTAKILCQVGFNCTGDEPDELTYRDECNIGFAKATATDSSCAYVEHAEGKNTCYAGVAQAAKDESFCEKMEEPSAIVKRNCYQSVAEAKSDPSICDRSGDKNNCLIGYVCNKKQFTVCDQVSDGRSFDCYQQISLNCEDYPSSLQKKCLAVQWINTPSAHPKFPLALGVIISSIVITLLLLFRGFVRTQTTFPDRLVILPIILWLAYIPTRFMFSGIGNEVYDQSMSVLIILTVSFIVAILLKQLVVSTNNGIGRQIFRALFYFVGLFFVTAETFVAPLLIDTYAPIDLQKFGFVGQIFETLLLFGPVLAATLMWLYLMITQKSKRKKLLLHFVPLLLAIVLTVAYFFTLASLS